MSLTSQSPAELVPYLQLSVLLLELLIFIRVTLGKLVHFNAKFINLFPDLCPHKTKTKGHNTEQYRNAGYIPCLRYHGFTVAYRWQKDLMFLLELASLQTPLPFSQQSTAAIRFADTVCVYINIHTHMLYTYIYNLPSLLSPSLLPHQVYPCRDRASNPLF